MDNEINQVMGFQSKFNLNLRFRLSNKNVLFFSLFKHVRKLAKAFHVFL